MAEKSSESTSSAGTSFDKLFKRAFEYLPAELLELVDPSLAATLDLTRAKLVGEQLFADFAPKGHVEPDLVLEVSEQREKPRLVLVHLESERKFRRTVDERMLSYGLHLRLKSKKPVVSIVVFLRGGRPGVEEREVLDAVGEREPLRFRYLAFGLSKCLAEEYVDRPQPLAAALASLMRSRNWDRVEQKRRCLSRISQASNLSLEGQFVLVRIVDSCLRLNASEEERYATEMAKEENKEARKMVVTLQEALAEQKALGLEEGLEKGREEGLEKGLERGREEGREEGRGEGQVEALQQAVLLSIERRFGSVPPAAKRKVRRIRDLGRLYELLAQVIEARSLADLSLN